MPALGSGLHSLSKSSCHSQRRANPSMGGAVGAQLMLPEPSQDLQNFQQSVSWCHNSRTTGTSVVPWHISAQRLVTQGVRSTASKHCSPDQQLPPSGKNPAFEILREKLWAWDWLTFPEGSELWQDGCFIPGLVSAAVMDPSKQSSCLVAQLCPWEATPGHRDTVPAWAASDDFGSFFASEPWCSQLEGGDRIASIFRKNEMTGPV